MHLSAWEARLAKRRLADVKPSLSDWQRMAGASFLTSIGIRQHTLKACPDDLRLG